MLNPFAERVLQCFLQKKDCKSSLKFYKQYADLRMSESDIPFFAG